MVDFDEVFSYDTFKVVKVKDRRLGILYRSFQIAILVYLITEIVLKQLYLKKEPPIPGAVRISLKAPDSLSFPSYCSSDSNIQCVFWGANEIQYPEDGAGVAFFTTRATVRTYQPPTGCDFLVVRNPNDPCFFNSSSSSVNTTTVLNKSYIGDIENYTMMIEHSIRGDQTSIALRNGLMDGTLMSADGKTEIKKMTNATRVQSNPKADGDIFKISDFLSAAGADLDAISSAPGADPGEKYRSSGIVIVILIEYTNVVTKSGVISYKYLPQVIEGNEYKTENAGLEQHGVIGQFDFIAFLTNIVASLALFKVATTIVELLMLNLLPQKHIYEEAKYETTDDFSDIRKNLKDREVSES
ncbi:1208_t:CDS:10 [Acaulospora morrowiae]|uniref:1208_t:CDS:1 n=1 Tax=Acaulospora morrowiae TaxID=94023 RepID=A0A9N9CNU0_9GLOM|nr:1208_t:CDS:10 [Acaulospora morrowiae]